MVIVSDTSPIINLAIIGHLDLIPRLFHKVILPQRSLTKLYMMGPDFQAQRKFVRQTGWKSKLAKTQPLSVFFPRNLIRGNQKPSHWRLKSRPILFLWMKIWDEKSEFVITFNHLAFLEFCFAQKMMALSLPSNLV